MNKQLIFPSKMSSKKKMPNNVPKKPPVKLKMLPQTPVGMGNAQTGAFMYPKIDKKREKPKI
jgi:hypothetical protein